MVTKKVGVMRRNLWRFALEIIKGRRPEYFARKPIPPAYAARSSRPTYVGTARNAGGQYCSALAAGLEAGDSAATCCYRLRGGVSA